MKIITQNYKPYPRLRGFVEANNLSSDQISSMLGVSKSYYNLRINGHAEWTLKDIHKFMGIMQEPLEAIGDFFPEGGFYD